jgi:hypothetical protein
MKKRTGSPPAVTGQASLDFIVGHIIEVVQATSHRKQARTGKLAAQILSRCLVNRFAQDHPLPFGELSKSDVVLEPSQLWLSGDLANGRAGAEFMYVCSPTQFVEELFAQALKVASAPIKASTNSGAIEGQISPKVAATLAETFTTAGTIYFLNNLRDKLNEAIEDLIAESSTVVEELYKGSLESSLSELEDKEVDPLLISQSRFTAIIKRIVAEGDSRRRKRLRAALWEIARGRGRPKGTRGSGTSIRFGKSQFFMQLNQKIREFSRGGESEVTRTRVAEALGLSNVKKLDRLRRQFGDRLRWREYVAQVTAGD